MDNQFVIQDYAVFGASLIVSTSIGIYHAFKNRHLTTVDDFLGGNSFNVIPLTISLVVSVVSAVTLLGLPAEMYTQGSQYVLNAGSGLGIILTAIIFVPLLHPLRLSSMFEYLELRFQSKAARLMGSIMEIIALLLYGGTALYAPVTAIAGVTSLPVWSLAMLLGIFVTLYTALGGMKAVVWTDVFQAFIMITAIIAVIIQGCIAVGGIHEVFDLNRKDNRIKSYNFDPDPRTRHTFWGLTIGFAFGGLSFYGASQFTFQRYRATKKLRNARMTVLLNLPLFYTFHLLLCFLGLIIYAYYSKLNCDPIASGRIRTANQLLPLFVLDTLGWLPGLPGLFLAALTSGALSTISSIINSVSTLIWDDLFKSKLSWLSAPRALIFSKLIVCFSGSVIVSLTFFADNFGPHIFQVCFALLGASGGPQLGMFLLGALIPWANWKGAVSGCLAGLLLTSWITTGSYITKPFTPPLPSLPTEDCTNSTHIFGVPTINNTIVYDNVTDIPTLKSSDGITELYKLSYTWYSAVGACLCMIVGMIVSLFTGKCKPADNLVIPWYKFSFWQNKELSSTTQNVRFEMRKKYRKDKSSQEGLDLEHNIPMMHA